MNKCSLHLWVAGASLLSLVLGCGPAPALATPERGPARYELSCDSSDTAQTSALFCVRLDTSTGDVKRIDLSKVKSTTGSTMGAEKGAGAFSIVCDSTDTAARSEFHCIRLDRATGEVVVVSLPKVESIAN